MTLADEDTNPLLTDDDNRTFLGNVAMQVMQFTQVMQVMQVKQFLQVMQVMQVIQDRIYTEKVTISCCAIWWPNL